jgi:hypothetical protein
MGVACGTGEGQEEQELAARGKTGTCTASRAAQSTERCSRLAQALNTLQCRGRLAFEVPTSRRSLIRSATSRKLNANPGRTVLDSAPVGDRSHFRQSWQAPHWRQTPVTWVQRALVSVLRSRFTASRHRRHPRAHHDHGQKHPRPPYRHHHAPPPPSLDI